MLKPNRDNTVHRRTAFTMVELLVVIMIIGLLASILMPSITAARNAAKVAGAQTTIFSLETALNMFRTEERLGRMYPPSHIPQLQRAQDPWGGNRDVGVSSAYDVWGAQTLVWAVVGADMLGTPGFHTGPGSPTLNVLYAPPPNQYQRYGPFVDPGKLEIVDPSDDECAINELGLGDLTALTPPIVNIPVILDSFGMPVLYWRPDRNPTLTTIRFMLPMNDNDPFVNMATPVGNRVSGFTSRQAYENFFVDSKAAQFATTPGAVRPHNYDSFILLSAGPDQTYGTSDDVANFKLNEQ